MQFKHVGTIAFIGSHLDVVPANPETWERNPFKLTVEVSWTWYMLVKGETTVIRSDKLITYSGGFREIWKLVKLQPWSMVLYS